MRSEVSDEHSGPAGGEIHYRRLGEDSWTGLPAQFERKGPEEAELVAHVPELLRPGTYVFRADAVDAAGNSASTTRRADGTEMALRKVPPPQPPEKPAVPREKTRIFARLRWHRRRGASVTVPYGAAAILNGRLLDAEGAGLAGRRLRIVARPSRGALTPAGVETVETGSHGGFRLDLPAGTSRRIGVAFAGEERLEPADRARRSRCGCAAESSSTRRPGR